MAMLAQRLTLLIEKHSDALLDKFEARVANSKRCTDYRRVPVEELRTLVGTIYKHLGEWLSTKTDGDVERRYTRIGMRRAEQGVPVSGLLWCIVLVKENLWEFMRDNQNLDSIVQLYGELELTHMVEQFFDRAMFYAVCGHEQVAQDAMAARK
jgi:hypothetical protein